MYKSPRLLAHYDIEDPTKKQDLLEHLVNVANISRGMGRTVGLENSCQLVALLHDFGKSRILFQDYIRGKYKGRVNHSSDGAIIIEEIQKEVFKEYNIEQLLEESGLKIGTWLLYKEILQYPILAHHGLYDIIDSNLEYRTGKRLEIEELLLVDIGGRDWKFLEEVNNTYKEINFLSISELYYQGFKEFIIIYKKILSMSSKAEHEEELVEAKVRVKRMHFYYGALVRLILAILKEADIYDSSNYYRREKDKKYSQEELDRIWLSMEETIENQYKKFRNSESKSKLDLVRTNLADEIYAFSKSYSRGAYKLDMPVGSGKTYGGLRYAIGNASQFKKQRVFYTTAFLSVLEQNASTIKELLGSEYILEHHSNIIEDYEGYEEEKDKKEYEVVEYLKESWESPIVLTTLVQLSNTMFKDRAANIRRFSKLINSVIIIDEIQSLPTKAIYNFNLMTNFLTNIMNVTIVHSTATPPGYDNEKVLVHPCIYGIEQGPSSVIKTMDNTDVFKRVDYYSLLGKKNDIDFNRSEIGTHIKKELEKEKSALVVLNTKGAVGNLYDLISKDEEIIANDIEVIYLTTNQCPKHRLDIINYMKDRLKNIRESLDGRKLICVSTKLVEAGVDIDFDLVYRSLAGLDNIIQVGGRCNREGKKSSRGKVFIFSYLDENIKYLPEIKKQQDASRTAFKILQRMDMVSERIDIEAASKFYFHKLYQNEEGEGNHMEFITKAGDDTILNLLANNPKLKGNYENKRGKKGISFKLRQSFKTAAKEFDLIKEDTKEVIVQYENKEQINSLYETIEKRDYERLKIILQELQPYTIGIRNVAEYEHYVTRELDGEILILNKEAYDKEIGLNKGSLQVLAF